MTKQCELYRNKFDAIFSELGVLTKSNWKFEEISQYIDALSYKTCVRGQKINIRLDFNKSQVKARVFVGNYKPGLKNYFSKEIGFSIDKKSVIIIKDIFTRLELDSLDQKIDKILSVEENERQVKEEKENKANLFKKLLPFNESFNDNLTFRKKGIMVTYNNVFQTLEIKANDDLMMQICAKINELIE